MNRFDIHCQPELIIYKKFKLSKNHVRLTLNTSSTLHYHVLNDNHYKSQEAQL